MDSRPSPQSDITRPLDTDIHADIDTDIDIDIDIDIDTDIDIDIDIDTDTDTPTERSCQSLQSVPGSSIFVFDFKCT